MFHTVTSVIFICSHKKEDPFYFLVDEEKAFEKIQYLKGWWVQIKHFWLDSIIGDVVYFTLYYITSYLFVLPLVVLRLTPGLGWWQ